MQMLKSINQQESGDSHSIILQLEMVLFLFFFWRWIRKQNNMARKDNAACDHMLTIFQIFRFHYTRLIGRNIGINVLKFKLNIELISLLVYIYIFNLIN